MSSDSPLLVHNDQDGDVAVEPKVKTKRSSKNFTSDLDSLFDEVLNDAMEEPRSAAQTATNTKRRSLEPLSGLDALIRRTTDEDPMEAIAEETALKRRVTLVFERSKIDKLKAIARKERTYLKDIVNELVSEFIQDYEKSKK